MTNKEINEYLTEAMGKCWHEWKVNFGSDFGECSKCGKSELGNMMIGQSDYDLFTPEGFFLLLNWSKKQKWWGDFMRWMNRRPEVVIQSMIEKITDKLWGYVDYETFPKLVCEFLKEREK